MEGEPSPLKLWLTHNRIKAYNSDVLAEFYCIQFGMKIISKIINDKINEQTYLLGYAAKDEKDQVKQYRLNTALLEITSPISTTTEKDHKEKTNKQRNCVGKYSVYWKIGINVFDLHHAVKRLNELNVKVTEPLIIPDVGVLCHVFDPEGYDIELMQFTFEGKTLEHVKDNNCTISQDGIFSCITIRVRDIKQSLRFYMDILGMKLLSKQDQSMDYGFDVYYLGFTNEVPPNPTNPNDVDNREWTYQRPYTLLELLVYTKGPLPESFTLMESTDFGFLGIGMACSDMALLKTKLQKHRYSKFSEEQFSDLFQTTSLTVYDPDNMPIRFTQVK